MALKVLGHSITRNYSRDGACIRCPACGSSEFIEKVCGVVQQTASEVDTKCAQCNTSVAFWAYGSFSPYPRYFDKSIPALLRRIFTEVTPWN